MKAIIPACGLGSRMNMKSNESKEMLSDRNNKPLIAWTLEQCYNNGITPVVITRKEKQDLILYCSNKAEVIVLDEIPSEWPATVLASKSSWGDNNILLLPDTRFESIEALKSAITSLKAGSEFVFGAHKVEDISKWGMIEYNKERKDLLVCEKPSTPGPGLAWGFIGFKNNAKSVNLFETYLRKEFLYLKNFDIVYLNSFKDITRTGRIE